jgi:hypothetical protein
MQHIRAKKRCPWKPGLRLSGTPFVDDEKGEPMSTIPTVQHYYWVGETFATYCLLQSGVIVSFTSLYVIPASGGPVMKERHWEHGKILSTQEAMIPLSYPEAVLQFNEKVDLFNTRMFSSYATRNNRDQRFSIKTRSPLKWQRPEIGEAVTCLRPTKAYYSHYAGNPHCFFEPGDVGVIGDIDVPAVYHNPENPRDLFACVDFDKPAVPTGGAYSTTMWRCSLYYHHMIHLSQYPGEKAPTP